MSAVLDCPKCNTFSVHSKDGILKCCNCGFIVYQSPDKYKCPICKTLTFFRGTCTKCGFTETQH